MLIIATEKSEMLNTQACFNGGDVHTCFPSRILKVDVLITW